MNGIIEDGLLGDPGIGLMGSGLLCDEAVALARKQYKWLPFCAVEEWIILDVTVTVTVTVTDEERAKIAAAGCLPMLLFAHKVVHDEQRRFEPGHWVGSSMGTTFEKASYSPGETPFTYCMGQDAVSLHPSRRYFPSDKNHSLVNCRAGISA